MFEEHLAQCSGCKGELEKIQTDIRIPKEDIEKNRGEGNVIKKISILWEQSKAKAFMKGVAITVILFTVILFGYIRLFRWDVVSVPTDRVRYQMYVN